MKQRKKKELKAILRQLDDRPLPKKENILSACENAFSQQPTIVKPTRTRVRPRRVLLAVGLSVLLTVTCCSIYAVADESREYREAAAFFEQHALSTDGYSRKEIKLIYRDIITGTFTYEKTAQAIEARVGGYEILQGTPTPEELELLWNYKDLNPSGMDHEGFDANGEVAPTGISYRYKNQVRYVETADEACAVLEKYRDGVLEWSKTLQSFSIEEVAFTENYVICRGSSPSGFVVKLLDDGGEELWQKTLSVDLLPRKLIVEADGFSVVCSDSYDFGLYCYSWQGRRTVKATGDYSRLLGRLNEAYSFRNAEKLGENFVIQLCNSDMSDFFIKVDREGTLLAVFSYRSEYETYYFTDVVEYCGSLYLSGYAVPRSVGGALSYGNELETLKETVKAGGAPLSNADTVQLLTEQYTAILMRCDSSTGQTQAFYSVKGALGGKISMDAQYNLVWRVESIADAYCLFENTSPIEPEITVFFKGICAVRSYIFDWRGFFLREEQAGESVPFER